MIILVNSWDWFLDFNYGHLTEAGIFENYLFLQNFPMHFDENQVAWLIFNSLLVKKIKKAKIKIWYYRYFENFHYPYM